MTREEAIIRLKAGEPFSEIHDPVWDEALKMAISALSAESIRLKGEWLLIGHDNTCNFYKCSFCDYEEHDNFTKHHNFCPNCGADMRGE